MGRATRPNVPFGTGGDSDSHLLKHPLPRLSRPKCWGEDLNLHALRHKVLNLACLPISPPQHFIRDAYTTISYFLPRAGRATYPMGQS